MNKIIAFLLVFCAAAANSAAQSTLLLPGSEDALSACRTDERKQETELLGMKALIVQKINLLEDGRCRVESVVNNDLGVNTTVCTFTAEQTKEIIRAEKDVGKEIYEETLPLRITDEDGTTVDGGQMTVKGTLKEIVWSRFLNDENICRSEFREKDTTQDLAAAVTDCKKFEKNLDLFGFRIGIAVEPDNGNCLYLFHSKTPGMTSNFAGKEGQTPPLEIEIKCRLSPKQRRQLADFIRSGGSCEFEFPVSRGDQTTKDLKPHRCL